MHDTKVIVDSEDEDEGFSPDHSPSKSLTADDFTGLADGNEKPGDEPTSDSRSTDPEFFKRFYENQQKAKDQIVPDTAQDAEGSKGSSLRQDKNNSSSITDPTMRKTRKGRLGRADSREFADLTQVTTPDAPSARQRDVYDFTISDEEGEPLESAGPSGKRKRRLAEDTTAEFSPLQLSTRTQASDGQDRPSRAKKKRKSAARHETQSDIPDAIDLLAVPTNADMDGIELRDSNNPPGSTVPNTLEDLSASRMLPPTSFFIDPPSRLTASQKQEYLPVSSHSELSGEEAHQQPSLPQPNPATQDQRSTNTDATIAYTTPSRYCSSAAPLPMPILDDMATSSPTRAQMYRTRGASSSRSGRADAEQWQPQSSPDELNPHLPPAPSRKTRRMRDAGVQDTHRHEEPWDSDQIDSHQENYVPRPSRRRSRAVEEVESVDDLSLSMPDTCPPGDISFTGGNDAQPILISSGQEAPQIQTERVEGVDPEFLAALPDDLRQEVISNHIAQRSSRTSQAARTRSRGLPTESAGERQPVSEDTPQPKKRGRKKKNAEGNSNEASVAHHAPEADPSPAPTATAATTRRKRGRPKKVEVVQPVSDPEAQHTSAAAEIAAPIPAAAGEPEPTEVLAAGSAQELQEITRGPSKRGRKKKVVEEAPTPPAQEQEGEGPSHDTRDGTEELFTLSVEGSGESAEIGDQREALKDISNASSQNASARSKTVDQIASDDGSGGGMQQETTPEPKAKEMQKSAPTSGQQGKVPLRVGLSKRSRIAPLLKIIRK
ncbi:hypothetical protein M406DRAFT_330340 [Cryphonectria parasitica EP155]|uniref:AT hook domain-containing protein n=1 Tax=Cryphonectria parasitica (strain ATCC 38755 / EP155) TaxID=660469 RepID=A0A9P5CPU2_CRYP1|nr:uncharacterized protein M406DRAFT_330340 [Cryphonectria parasitica EP155]KAF3766533.1 hypothetical protein M406DRAFT_330340 [Cryphonectria parasitica EP155]